MQISTSEFNASFSTVIDKLFKRETQNLTDDDWIHFLQDHRDLIKKTSKYLELDEQTMYRYRYRIRDFLTNKGYVLGAEQAFRVVNRLDSDLDFDLTLTGVWMPDDSFISELRRKYATNLAKQKKM